MKTASELWDLLHEVAPFIPVAEVDLYDRVQSALDEGAAPKDFGTCTKFFRVQEWDGVQGKYRTLKSQCRREEAEKLCEQYKHAGKQVHLFELSHYQTEVKST
jgi:hypothetical protein